MSNLDLWVKGVHQRMDYGLLRLFSLAMALAATGLVMWDPRLFAQAIGGFGPIISPALIWSTCTAMVFGVGFVPRHWYWQVFFTPFVAMPVLTWILWLRLFS